MRTSIVMVAALGLLAGCTRETVIVTPQALPGLAEQQAVPYERTRDGRRVIEDGPIRWVVLHGRPAETIPADARAEWFRAPFRATLSGGDLHLADEQHQSVRALGDIQEVEVHYDARIGSPAEGTRITGIVLTTLGSAALAAGVGVIGWDVGSPHANPNLVVLMGVPLLATSTVFAGAGIPLWVVGARRAAPGHAALPTGVPAVAPARNGASLRWAF